MGTGMFLFRTLTLKREKSDLNLLMARLGRQKRAYSREASIFARQSNQQRTALSQWYNMNLQALRDSNTQQAGLDGSSNTSFGGLTCGLNANQSAQMQALTADYQAKLQQIEAEQQLKEQEIKDKEADLEEEMALVKTEMEQIDAELKEVEKACSESIKDSAPKYVA